MSQISVIIPVYNGALFIQQALDSIQQQAVLIQEVIVVDDGSTDRTAEIVEQHPIVTHYHFQQNRGPQYARSKGLELSTGDIITFLDADDVWAERKLSIQLKRISQYDIIIGYSRILEAESPSFLFLNLAAALFKRKVFHQLGGFDTTFLTNDDLDFFFRAREEGIKILVHEELVLYHRRHPQNLTRMRADQNGKELLQRLQQSLQRRRKTGKFHQKQFSEFREKNKNGNFSE